MKKIKKIAAIAALGAAIVIISKTWLDASSVPGNESSSRQIESHATVLKKDPAKAPRISQARSNGDKITQTKPPEKTAKGSYIPIDDKNPNPDGKPAKTAEPARIHEQANPNGPEVIK